MGFIGNLIGDTLGGITGAKQAAKGARKAAATEAAAAEKGIAELRDARTEARELQQPYVNAGMGALEQQMALLGLGGDQRRAIDGIIAGPEYQTAVRQGEEAILANASATGGLRGGNIQSALFDNRANLVPSLLNQQFQRLGGLSSLGQNAAAGVGNNSLNTANNIGGLLGQQAAAIAGGQIAKGNLVTQNLSNMAQIAGTIIGAGGFGGGGGGGFGGGARGVSYGPAGF